MEKTEENDKSKLELKSTSKPGRPFGIHSLNEVHESGQYKVVGWSVTEDDGFPPAKYCNCKDCYIEAQLTVARNSSSNGQTEKEVIGQSLIISNKENNTTAMYLRSWSSQDNKGMWSEWQMVATGDPKLITENNDINKVLSILRQQVENDSRRIETAENSLLASATVRFDRIEENETTINAGEIGFTPTAIVYYKPVNKFVAADSAGDYWDTWDGMETYMSGGKIREDKVYLRDGLIYIWDGSELSLLTRDVDSGLVNIADIIRLEGANTTGVYKASKPLSRFRTYRIHLQNNKWSIPTLGDTTSSIFEIYYKKHDGSFDVLARCNTQTTPQEYYDVTIPDYFPVNTGLTVYIRAKKGEKITFVFEDVTDKIFNSNNNSAVYTENGLMGENIPLTENYYVDAYSGSFGDFITTAEYRTRLVPIKKGDIFYITGKGGRNVCLFQVFDTQNNRVTKAGDNADWNNTIYQVHVDGYLHFCCNIHHPYKIVKLDRNYISDFSELNLLSSIRFSPGFIRWKTGTEGLSDMNNYTGWVPVMGFNQVELTVNVVGTEDVSTGLAFYDSDRNFLSGIKSPYYGGEGEYVMGYETVEYNIPEGAAYLRTTIFNEYLDEMVLKLKRTQIADVVDENTKSVEYTYADLTWIAGYPYYNTGVIGNSTVNKYCEIEVDGREYSVIESVVAKTLGGASPGIVFYDKNDTYITGYQCPNYGTSDTSIPPTSEVRKYRIPRDARKVRIACRNEFADVFYCKLFNEVDSNYDSITRLNEAIKDKWENLLVGSPRLYISEKVSDVYSSLDGKKTSELYTEWDSMAERFPEYISRGEDLGEVTKNGATYALRQYTIGYNQRWFINHEPSKDEIVKDTAANFWQERDNARKSLIPIGMHGEEKTACWGAMLAFKELLESNEEWAMFIKSNFVLKVIPTLNPSGFNDCVREASDGNVMNREVAVNTPETIMYYNWVEQNKDAFLLMDFHGTQGRYAYLPCWDGSPLYDIVKRATIQLSSSLYSNYKEFYNSIYEGYGETYVPFIIAKFNKEAAYYACSYRIWEDYGIPAFALETPANLVIPNADGSINTTLSGLIHRNDLRNCKIAKDLLINCIQIFGCVDSIGDYYVR